MESIPARHHLLTISLFSRGVLLLGGNITHRYESALLGFSAELPNSSVMAMTDNVHVDYVEADGEVTAYARKAMEDKKWNVNAEQRMRTKL